MKEEENLRKKERHSREQDAGGMFFFLLLQKESKISSLSLKRSLGEIRILYEESNIFIQGPKLIQKGEH